MATIVAANATWRVRRRMIRLCRESCLADWGQTRRCSDMDPRAAGAARSRVALARSSSSRSRRCVRVPVVPRPSDRFSGSRSASQPHIDRFLECAFVSRVALIALIALALTRGLPRSRSSVSPTSRKPCPPAGFCRAAVDRAASSGSTAARDSRSPTTDSAGSSQIRAYDPATGRDSLLFSGEGLTLPGNEAMRSSTSRSSGRAISRTSSSSPTSRNSFAARASSDFYVYSLGDEVAAARRQGRAHGRALAGRQHARRRAQRRHVRRSTCATHTERRLTSDATEHVFNGHFDWVYEEEFGLAQAWSWSPDSRHIAFWQVDERRSRRCSSPTTAACIRSGTSCAFRSPATTNPDGEDRRGRSRTGKKVWLDPHQTGEFYIPRIYWTSQPRHARDDRAEPKAERHEAVLLRREHRRLAPGDGGDVEDLDRRVRLLRRCPGPHVLSGERARILLGLRPRRLSAHLPLRLLRAS